MAFSICDKVWLIELKEEGRIVGFDDETIAIVRDKSGEDVYVPVPEIVPIDEAVPPDCGCPKCKERYSDHLVWIDDENVECQICETIYQLGKGEV